MEQPEVLYHAEIGLPASFVAPTGVVCPKYSRHARAAAVTDRYGHMRLPSTICLSEATVIEVGYRNGRLHKILYRLKYNFDLDMCIVLIPGEWFAKTCWFNERTDLHRTLDRSRYAVA